MSECGSCTSQARDHKPSRSRTDERTWSMLIRILLLLAAFSMLGTGAVSAKSHHVRRHPAQATVVDPPPAPYDVPTLVLHPANNIACNTPYRSTRALPCDQPV